MARPPDGALEESPRLLVVRRDNIGDLVCTTPLFAALRLRFPRGWIGALVNSYNAPVLAGNPDVDEVFVYEKLKHRRGGVLSNLWTRYRLIANLRERELDYVVLAGGSRRSLALAKSLRAKKIVGFGASGGGLDIALSPDNGGQEVEITFALARAFGISGPPPPLRVLPDEAVVARLRGALAQRGLQARPIVGIHLSARKPSQRWPAERFAELISEIARDERSAFLLFWSPGSQVDPRHPGDDEAARRLLRGLDDRTILPVRTEALADLIAGLALCDRVILSDGGAMHLAAALGKPVVCFFGRSEVRRWRPWGVPYELLQPPTREVKDLSVAEVAAAYRRLTVRTGSSSPAGTRAPISPGPA